MQYIGKQAGSLQIPVIPICAMHNLLSTHSSTPVTRLKFHIKAVKQYMIILEYHLVHCHCAKSQKFLPYIYINYHACSQYTLFQFRHFMILTSHKCHTSPTYYLKDHSAIAQKTICITVHFNVMYYRASQTKQARYLHTCNQSGSNQDWVQREFSIPTACHRNLKHLNYSTVSFTSSNPS